MRAASLLFLLSLCAWGQLPIPGSGGAGGGGGGASPFFGDITAVTVASSATPAFSLSPVAGQSPIRFEIAPLVNVTTPTITNLTAGATFFISITTDGTHTWSWNNIATNVCPIYTAAVANTVQKLQVSADGVTINGLGCVSNIGGLTYFGSTVSASATSPGSGNMDCRTTTSGLDCYDGTTHWKQYPSTGLALSALAAQAADTVVMNATGGSAAPTAYAMPTCTSGADLYNTSTHAWTCVSTGGGSSTPPYIVLGSSSYIPDLSMMQATLPDTYTWTSFNTPSSIATTNHSKVLGVANSNGNQWRGQTTPVGTVASLEVAFSITMQNVASTTSEMCGVGGYDGTTYFGIFIQQTAGNGVATIAGGYFNSLTGVFNNAAGTGISVDFTKTHDFKITAAALNIAGGTVTMALGDGLGNFTTIVSSNITGGLGTIQSWWFGCNNNSAGAAAYSGTTYMNVKHFLFN